jgi:two-component system response regulator VicR
MLTAREEEVDKVLGLELGADDYITKPLICGSCSPGYGPTSGGPSWTDRGGERPKAADPGGEIEVDTERYTISKGGKPVDLTIREYELLKFLIAQPSKVFSRESLLEQVWGYEYFGDVRTVDVTIRRLREKIEDGPEPRYIMTRRGVGYYFNGNQI